MLFKEKAAIAKRLQEAIPLLNKHHPDGWVDFRQPLPPEWRSDLYVKLPSDPPLKWDGEKAEVPCFDDVDDPITDIQMRCRFASLRIACEAAMQVRETCQCGVRIDEANNKSWGVSFSVPAQEVCW